MTKEKITLQEIAGYATERMVWQMMLNLCDSMVLDKHNGIMPHSICIVGNDFRLDDNSPSEAIAVKAFSAPETFGKMPDDSQSEKSAVWTIGALAFFAITGTDVFEGKGGETQTDQTEVPRIGSVHASIKLSTLIRQCLSYSPADRPTIEDIKHQAQESLAESVVPRKRLTSQGGKSYTTSLIKFWPEEMVSVLLLCMLLFHPIHSLAQTKSGLDKSVIPNEMAALVLRCIDLRSAQNVGKVSKAMGRDMSWTMMDELPLDKQGECTSTDVVDVFGLNDMGFSILKRHGGVTNSGGRFRDGRDPRYKYSFIEITVKKKGEVNYQISGREGEQVFAVVPFDKNAKFEASILHGQSYTDSNGVQYIQLKQGIKKNDSFKLTIKNNSDKNMAFALINYNSRNHE